MLAVICLMFYKLEYSCLDLFQYIIVGAIIIKEASKFDIPIKITSITFALDYLLLVIAYHGISRINISAVTV